MIKLPVQIPTYSPFNLGWSQLNRSDVFGALWSSFNLDLNSNIGHIRGTRMLQNTSTAGTFGASADSDLTGVPVGFRVYNSKIWTVAGSKVHASVIAAPQSIFLVDATASSPTDCDSIYSDIEIFNGSMYVTGGNKLYKYNGAWSNVAIAGGGPWLMTTYNGRLYIAIAGLGKIYSTSDGATIITPTAQYSIDLGQTDQRISFMRSSSNRIWVGTVNQYGKGYIYEWDGSATTFTRSYRMQSVGVFACVIKDDIPWVMDANGKLMTYSNGTFKEVARLPLRQKYLYNANNFADTARFIHPNGMTLVDGRINLLVNNLVNNVAGTIIENVPSGIWEYDDITGSLYHKYSLSYTSTALGTAAVYDYGQNRVSKVGGLSDMNNFTNSTSAANETGTLLAGATVYTNATSTETAIFVNDTYENLTGSNTSTQRGSYFITSKFLSSQIRDKWQTMFVKYRQFRDSNDSLRVKYRVTEADPTDISITWTSTNKFTTTTSVLTLEGYEVEIVQGRGSGKCAHITKIDVTGGTYTVTLDDTFTNASGTAKARVQNWKKISGTATDQIKKNHEFKIGIESEWIQFKVCFMSQDRDEIDGIIITNSPAQ